MIGARELSVPVGRPWLGIPSLEPLRFALLYSSHSLDACSSPYHCSSLHFQRIAHMVRIIYGLMDDLSSKTTEEHVVRVCPNSNSSGPRGSILQDKLSLYHNPRDI